MTCLNAPTTRCTAFSRAECRHRACDRQRERTARAAARACLDRRQLATAVLLSAAVSRPAQAGGEGGRCTLDLAVDGQKQGSITIELLDGTSTGCRRFSDLCKGVQGVGYRRSKIDALFPVRLRSICSRRRRPLPCLPQQLPTNIPRPTSDATGSPLPQALCRTRVWYDACVRCAGQVHCKPWRGGALVR